MADFLILFVKDSKRFICNKIHLGLLFLAVILVLFITHQATGEYKNKIAQAEEFQKLEAAIFSKIPNYDKYSDIGLRVFFSPAASSIFYDLSPAMTALYGKVNSIFDLHISNNAKTAEQLRGTDPLRPRFSSLILLLVSLVALLLGSGFSLQKPFLDSQSSAGKPIKIFLAGVLSRAAFMVVYCCLLILSYLVYLKMDAVTFTPADTGGMYPAFNVMLVTLLFFFFLGMLTGGLTLRKWIAYTLNLLMWILFILIAPSFIYSITENTSTAIPSPYKVDNEKVDILKNFEERISKTLGRYSREKNEDFKKAAESFWNHESMQLTAIEKDLRDSLLSIIERKERLTALTPVTFYLETCSAGSSYGNRSFIDFYSYLIELQRKFLRFWIDRVYYNDPKVMVNFVQGDENIFRSSGKTPGNYIQGLLLNSAYVLLLAFLSYLVFYRSLYRISKTEIDQLGEVNIRLEKGSSSAWLVKKDYFKKLLFNFFSGKTRNLVKKGFKGHITITGSEGETDSLPLPGEGKFLYVCRAEHIPQDMKVKDLVAQYAALLKIKGKEKKNLLATSLLHTLANETFGKLGEEKQFEVLLAIMDLCKDCIILIDDIATGLPIECPIALKNRLEEWQKKNTLVIYLTSTARIDSKEVEMKKFFYPGKSWLFMLQSKEAQIETLKNIMDEER